MEQLKNESSRQYEYMEEMKKWVQKKSEELGRKLTCHVTTFGCQMNEKDSEKLLGILETIGYEEVETEDADFLIFNTCTVRENANTKLYGHLGQVKKMKERNSQMMIGLCGCMMQEEHVIEKIRTSYKFVDIIFGTHNIFKLAELLKTRVDSKGMIVDIWKDTDQIVEDLPSDRKFSFKCGVNIMYGCNNFCSYCIVPYVRGRERSRKPEDIIKEVKQVVSEGVKEVMLLGQNVNSYGKTLETPVTFSQLLKEVEKIEGLKRIRFMTSHPKDLSDELIEAMRDCEKVCNHLHLPLQSGSSRILKAMNRRYTKEQYLALEITKYYSKDEILLRYMNAINLGQNTLGVESASLRYFGKHCSDLTISECAVIASITQNPSKYNPIRHPEENVKRRKTCLTKMLELGFITQAEYDEAIADTDAKAD